MKIADFPLGEFTLMYSNEKITRDRISSSRVKDKWQKKRRIKNVLSIVTSLIRFIHRTLAYWHKTAFSDLFWYLKRGYGIFFYNYVWQGSGQNSQCFPALAGGNVITFHLLCFSEFKNQVLNKITLMALIFFLNAPRCCWL